MIPRRPSHDPFGSAVGSPDKAMRSSQSRPIISHIEMTLLCIILTRKLREDGVAQAYKSSQHTLSILNGKGISEPVAIDSSGGGDNKNRTRTYLGLIHQTRSSQRREYLRREWSCSGKKYCGGERGRVQTGIVSKLGETAGSPCLARLGLIAYSSVWNFNPKIGPDCCHGSRETARLSQRLNLGN
jgi:hypothetical protein